MSRQQIGVQLRKAREQKGWTLEDAVRETRIKSHYLQAMEEGNLDSLPSPVQIRGFLRSYSNALNLDSEQMLYQLESAPQNIETQETVEKTYAVSSEQTQQAEAIFQELSQVMKGRRDMLGLSIEDVSQFTHIPIHYLGMIERAAFDEFPSPVQAQGMIGNYANFLEMDRDAVLLNFAEGLQAQLSARQAVQSPSQPRPRKNPVRNLKLPTWLGNIITPDRLTVFLIVTFLIFFVAWGMGSILTTQEGLEATPTAEGLSGVLLPSPTVNISPTPQIGPTATVLIDDDGAATEEAPITIPTIDISAVQVFIIVRQRTWLRVTVDDEIAFEGRVLPGSNLPYSANERIELLTGNAAALQVFYNDRDMGVLGIYGEIINNFYTREGLITPTPLASPTINPNAPTPTPLLED